MDNKTQELKIAEFREVFNHELSNKEISQIGVQSLSEPSTFYLKITEEACPNGHIIKLINQFSLNEKFCPIHNVEFEKTPLSITPMEVKNFVVKTITGDTITLFFKTSDIPQSMQINIYDKLDVCGFPVTIKTRTSGIFAKGIFCSKITSHIEELSKQTTMITLPNVIEKLMSGLPKLKYPEEVWTLYKHSLLLPLVYDGINILVIGDKGTVKSEFGKQLQKISGGTFAETQNTTEVGLIGCVVKDLSGQFSFQGGLIFDAKNNVLILDEVDKVINAGFYQKLNGILANGRFSYHKATIKIDKDFPMSFIGLGNPHHQQTFKGIPKHEIEKTFSQNADFLSRMHLMIALKENKGIELPLINSNVDLNDIKIYIKMAKQIKLNKSFSKEVEDEIKAYTSRQFAKSKDLRFQKKFLDLCYAEAKLNLHKDVQITDVKTIEKIIEIQDKLLYDY